MRREVDKEEGQALADALGALFIETSAKQVCRRSENGFVDRFLIITNVTLERPFQREFFKGKGVEEAFKLLSEEVLLRLEVDNDNSVTL